MTGTEMIREAQDDNPRCEIVIQNFPRQDEGEWVYCLTHRHRMMIFARGERDGGTYWSHIAARGPAHEAGKAMPSLSLRSRVLVDSPQEQVRALFRDWNRRHGYGPQGQEASQS